MPSPKWSSKEFFREYSKPGPRREAAIVNEVLNGNTPSWAFDFMEIFIGEDYVEVASDYLAIGTDTDYIYVSLTSYAAQYIAQYFNEIQKEPVLGFPTWALVDQIFKRADHVIISPPEWSGNDSKMRAGDTYLEWNKRITEKFHENKLFPGNFIAGHGKDVISDLARMNSKPYHVVIYGWQKEGGGVWQSPSGVHDWFYEDYSHRIRFIRETGKKKWSGPCCLWEPPLEFLKELENVG